MSYGKNPQTAKLILFHSKDITVQRNKQQLVITDKAGEQHSISEKRQQLWGLFKDAHDGEPFMLIYETYNNVQYVADARAITDDLLKLAIADMGTKLADRQIIERNRSTSLSYAKDLVVAGQEELVNLYQRAKQNYDFISEGKVQ